MARYKIVDRNPKFIPVVLDAQLMPGSFEYALDFLVDNELDLSRFDARYKNDDTGAPAYSPAVMIKIVLLAYSRGLISSRGIERACRENVLFMAISGDSAPQFTTIAKFVRELGPEVARLFAQVLLTCDSQGLIGRHMFAIDGVKLPSNASKHKSGTHAELAHDAERMEKAVAKMLKAHQSRDTQSEPTLSEADEASAQKYQKKLLTESRKIRTFLAENAERTNAKGKPIKSNITDNESAKMATSKGVIQGYTGVVAVDSQYKIIVAAKAKHKFTPKDFTYDADENTCVCPAGKALFTTGNPCTTNGRIHIKFVGDKESCGACEQREKCLRTPEKTPVRQVSFMCKEQNATIKSIETMKQAIDSEQGRKLYSKRMGTVEPVFGNLRANKGLNRFTLRSQAKVDTQWNLYCLVHNIEKLAHHGYGGH